MRSQRLIAAAVVIALSGALAGCSSGFSNWDPSDLLDFLDTKKKLPGERKPVFPSGVPGLEQGVPKDLYKGAAQQQDTPGVAAVQPEQPKPQKPAKKGKGKQPAGAAPAQDAQAPATTPDAEAAPEEEGSTAAAPPAPKPKKIVRRRTTAPPPDAAAPQAAQPAAQPQQAGSPFPAPMPAGTFQR
jgi:hypothetical protein